MRQLISLTLFIGLSIQLFSQTNISGRISDAATNEPLTGASLVLLSDFSNGAVTDTSGIFNMSIPDSLGKVELLIQYMGYEEQLLAVDAKQNQLLEIALKQSALSIEQVTVRATPTLGEEFVVKEITKLEIYTNPNSRADPIRAVNSLPASTSTDETANLSLRGSPASETGFVLNRVPIDDVFKLDQSNGVGQFSIFNTSIISKVDVYPSNPPLEFGGASSGLIALYTDDVRGENTRSASLTMASAGFRMSQKLNKRNGLVAYANYSLNNGLKAVNKRAFEDLESFNSFDAGAYWVSNINDKTKLKVFNYSLAENYAYHVELPAFKGTSLQEKKRNQTIINLEKRLGDKTNVDFNQGINFSKAQYDFGNTNHVERKKDFFSSLNLSRFDDIFTFGAGLSVHMNFIDNNGQYSEFFWALAPEHPALGYVTKETFILPELFTYQKIRFPKHFVLAISHRTAIAASENAGDFSSSQINLSYNPNTSNNYKLSFGKYHKLFIPGEQFYQTTLASSTHYSLDYSFSKNKFNLNAAVYAKKTNYEDWDMNISGAELFVAYENESIKTSVSLAHVNSEIQTAEARYPSGNDLNYFFRHLMKYKLSTLLEFNYSIFLRSGSFYTPVSGSTFHPPTQTFEPIYSSYQDMQRLPDYSLWDLSISKLSPVGDGVLIVFVSMSNVLGKKNVSGIEYNSEYEKIGNTYFGSRVFFVGAVYNW